MTFEHPIILLMIVFTMIMSCHLIATIANAVKAHHARRRSLREIVPSLHQIVQDLNALQNDLRDFLDRFNAPPSLRECATGSTQRLTAWTQRTTG
jgi:hypothetical protein